MCTQFYTKDQPATSQHDTGRRAPRPHRDGTSWFRIAAIKDMQRQAPAPGRHHEPRHRGSPGQLPGPRQQPDVRLTRPPAQPAQNQRPVAGTQVPATGRPATQTPARQSSFGQDGISAWPWW